MPPKHKSSPRSDKTPLQSLHQKSSTLLSTPSRSTHKLGLSGKSSTRSAHAAKRTVHQAKSPRTDKTKGPTERAPKKHSVFQQYCVVDGRFVPVKTEKDQRELEKLLEQTAASLQHKSLSEVSDDLHFRQWTSVDNSPSGSMFSKQPKTTTAEIGIQYSERWMLPKQTNEVASQLSQSLLPPPPPTTCEAQVYVDIQMVKTPVKTPILLDAQCSMSPKPNRELTLDKSLSISQLLRSLMNFDFQSEEQLKELSDHQKRYYRSLFEDMVSKLTASPRKPRLVCSKSEAEEDRIEFEKIEDLIAPVEAEVYKRECEQMSWIQREVPTECVDTSLMGMVTVLCNLFCFVTMKYSEEVVLALNSIYGPRYRQKYYQIVRKSQVNLNFEIYPVLDAQILREFSEQLMSQCNPHQLAHEKALLDFVNECAKCYRPFYQNVGESFPWSICIYPTISQFVVEQDSLEIIFKQIKEKLIECASTLCGIHVGAQNHPMVKAKRDENQQKMIDIWLADKHLNNDAPYVEMFGTDVMYKMSLLVERQVIQEAVSQLIRLL